MSDLSTPYGLLEKAVEARENAFCPYSDYRVGSAIMTERGWFVGANIEVSGRSTSIHAEMLAVFNAVLDGAQDFKCLAIAPDGEDGIAPCGLCQHTLAQFTEDLRIYEYRGENTEPAEYSLAELIGPAYSPNTRHQETVTNE
jgi:cytidine deaminase